MASGKPKTGTSRGSGDGGEAARHRTLPEGDSGGLRVGAAVAFALFLASVASGAEPSPGNPGDPARPRYVEAPRLIPDGSAGAFVWIASLDCSTSDALVGLLGARVGFESDFDLDGAPDAVDSLGIAPADCGEIESGRVALRRRPAPAHPAVLRTTLRAADGTVAAAHAFLAAAPGALVSLSRYCAAPRDGEPEWIEIHNRSAFVVPENAVLVEGRVLPVSLAPGAAVVVGADTNALRVWHPGARLAELSSWPNLRNSGDTIRLAVATEDGPLVLDSAIYGPGAPSSGSASASARPACVSGGDEDAVAAAHGCALEITAPGTVAVRAPDDGRYDLRAYDTDGVLLCTLAHAARGPAEFPWPPPGCRSVRVRRAGTVILHLVPRGAPGVRAVLRAGRP